MSPVTVGGFYFQALGRRDNDAIKYWNEKLNADGAALDTGDLLARFALEELLSELGVRKVKSSAMVKMQRRLRAWGFDFGLLEIQRVWDAALHREPEDSKVPEDQALKIRICLFRFISEDHEISDEALDAVIERAEGRVRDV